MTAGTTILVFAESIEETRDRVTEEAVVAATRLGGAVTLAILGAGAEDRAALYATWAGVGRVVHAHDAALESFAARPWTDAAASVVAQVEPDLIVIPATLAGRDLAPRLATRLMVPIASDAVALERQGTTIVAQRQVLGGRQVSDIMLGAVPAIVSLRPGSVRERIDVGGTAVVEALTLTGIRPSSLAVVATDVAEREAEGIATADRIVSGGRGLGKPDNFALVEELATVLNAAVGASGATVGAGWRPHSQQVGSTGTIVSPRLYLAVGISGAVQHTIGMSGSENIVAINRDPEAPIFAIASLGVVGDLFEIVPALIDELKHRKA